MKSNRLDIKITELILDEAKVKEKANFDRGKLSLRWFLINLNSFALTCIGSSYSYHLFGSSIPMILIVFSVFVILFLIKNSIQLFLMNRELGALKQKWLNYFLSFFLTIISLIYLILSMVFAHVWPENELFIGFKEVYFIASIPFVLTYFLLFVYVYFSPVIHILEELRNSRGVNPYDEEL